LGLPNDVRVCTLFPLTFREYRLSFFTRATPETVLDRFKRIRTFRKIGS
jgi:hypothetical protein